MTHRSLPLGRRSFLAAAGLTGAATLPLLAGCGGSSTADTVATDIANLPSYTPITAGPTPDLPGGEVVQPMFSTAPQVGDLFSSVDESMLPNLPDPVSAFILSYSPPPPSENSYLDGVNARLGSDLSVQIVPADSYSQKFATTVAGNDMPDLVQFLTWDMPANYPQLLDSQFMDLTELLSGEAINEFPNLANIPTVAWEGARVNGKIWGVPLHRPPFGNVLVMRSDLIKEKTGEEPAPQNREEFEALLDEINDPRGGQYALTGNSAGDGVYWCTPIFGPMFGVPNEWQLEGDTLTSKYETEQYLEMVDYIKGLWSGGYFHPDTPSMAQAQAKSFLHNGTVLMQGDGNQALLSNELPEDVILQAMVSFAADGGPGGNYQGLSSFSFTALKKAESERAPDLLKLINYLAAPFGSEEAYFLSYGAKGDHHTVDDAGLPVLTEAGSAQIGPTGMNRIGQGPQVITSAVPQEERMRRAHEWQVASKDMLIENPVAFLYSPTRVKTSSVTSTLESTATEYILGRSSLDDLTSAVKDWTAKSGDGQRAEYLEQLG